MLFSLSDRTQLELCGADRARFLHGFCTNDIKGLSPGRGCEAFVCTIQGKVLGHIFVFCTESSLWIDTVPGQEDVLFAHFDRYLINEDVQIHRRTAESGDLFLIGESASRSLEAIGCDAMARLTAEPVLSHLTASPSDVSLQIRSVDWLGEPGFLVSLPRAASADITRRLLDAGEIMADAAIWNSLRIEAGFPWYGIDITSDNLAQEANRTARCISFTKGCYLGQEPIARIDALGHVNRELVRLTVDGDDVPSAGTPLLDPETNGQVGVITSAAKSARTSGAVVALGYLRTKFREPGKQLSVSMPGSIVLAVVR